MRRALPVLVVLVLAAIAWLAWRQGWLGSPGDTGTSDTDDGTSPSEKSSGGLAAGGAKIDPNKDPAMYDGDPVGRVDAGLGRAGLKGVVTSEAGPIRFARVVAVLAAPASVSVRTTKDGTFEFAGLAAGDLDVRASSEGFLSRTVRAPALVDGVVADVGEVRLKARPDASDGVEVKVLDEAGRPVAGARVTVSTLPMMLVVSIGALAGVPDTITREGKSDDLGVARFAGLPPQKYDVVVRAQGSTLETVENLVVAAGRVEHVTVTVHPALSIAGTIVDADGAPVAGAHAGALLMPIFRSFEMALSDASGRFTIGGLVPGTYMVYAGEDHKGEGVASQAKAGDRALVIKLAGAGTLEGRVLLADGKPAPHFVVRPYTGDPFRYTFSRQFEINSAEGRFSLSLAPGPYQVDVKAEGGSLTSSTPVSIVKDATAKIEVRLRAEGVVAGVVTDAAGEHLAGSEIYVKRGGFPPEPVREQYVRADADGHFVLKALAIEPVKLHVRHAGHAAAEATVTPSADGAGKEITVRLPDGARVIGRVTTKDGRPVAGEVVNLSAPNFFDFLETKAAVTGADGAYEFSHVGAGSWVVVIGGQQPGRSQRKPVTTSDSGQVTVDFQTEGDTSASGTITGHVLVGGQPSAKATVTAEDERGPSATVSAETDAEGRYTLRGLKAGRVLVNASTAAGLNDSDSVRIPEAGQTVVHDFTFGSAGVRALLLGPDGKTPVSGAWVVVEALEKKEGADIWESVKAQLNSDERGVVSATGLDPGTYRLRIAGSGYAARLTDPFAIANGESKDVGSIRLASGGGITGRVTDDSGAPVEGVGVSVRNAQGENVFLFNFASTGSNGRFEMQGLEYGDYTLRFEGKGFAPVTKPAAVTATGAVVEVVVRRGGSVTVRVQDERGDPGAGAKVELFDAAGRRLERTLSIVNLFDADVTKIGASGTTTIPDLAPGSYRVGARKDVKDGVTLVGEPVSVTIEAGAQAQVTVVLK